MTYLILQIWLGLIITFILGIVFGYFMGKNCAQQDGKCCPTKDTSSPSEPATFDGNLDTTVALDSEEYAIETLEGIGPRTGQLFRGVGVETVGAFLRELNTPEQRQLAAEKMGIKAEPIHEWASMADLLRIEGMDHQFAELAHASGVLTVAELASKKAKDLTKLMAKTNASGRQLISPIDPTNEQVSTWVKRATAIKPIVIV